MLLVVGVNINWVASQPRNSPLVVATVYSKWINGQADKDEIGKLNTRNLPSADEIERTEANRDGDCSKKKQRINRREN